ncbi:MAG: hypothetical protein EU516_01930 [Promethearchaeota archaeon]|nr:MAG: hypothetical protein EU516_01930 [Candidatus Lokiarchaeota archaeon]
MSFIENLKKLTLKENWKYLIIVILLLIGIAVIQIPVEYTITILSFDIDLWDLIGVVIFLPFLTFVMFLFLLSLIAKKDVKEISSWKVMLIFLAALPLMIIISIILVGLFLFSILSYIFLTSWFILYGAYLTSKRLDDNLKKRVHSSFYRGILFIGGIIGALLLLIGYIFGSSYIGVLLGITITQNIYNILNYVVLIVGLMIIAFSVIGIVYLFKGIFNAWLGIFSILTVIYTFYLLVKIFFALNSTGGASSSIYTQFGLIAVDLFIILYSISTLMGSQADLLFKRLKLKRIGLDTILIWLIFSKVAYEFAHNFPYSWLAGFPYIDILSYLDESIVNLGKNIGVLIFFILILAVLGLYQMHKYSRQEKLFKKQVDKDVRELLSPQFENSFESNTSKNQESPSLNKESANDEEFS